MNCDPLKLWEEKRHFFEQKLVYSASAKEQYELRKNIEECDENIQRLKPSAPVRKEFSATAVYTYEKLRNIIDKHGRYIIEDLTPEFAKEGVIGLVCKGFDKRLKRNIAIKCLKLDKKESDLISHSDKFRWFKKAVTEACKLSDESSFIAIYEAYMLDDYEDHIWENSVPYFTMQYIEGASLRTHINNGDYFEPKLVREFIVSLISGIISSHEKRISHRNIRPSNIMLQKTESGVLRESKILLSPLQWSIDISCSHQMIKNLECKLETIIANENNINYFLEELAYLPPELFDCYEDSPEARFLTDQYLIGLLAYELLTHKLPHRLVNFSESEFRDHPITEFTAIKENLQEGLYAFKDDIIELKDCPESFKGAILKMISKNPKDRFQSLKEARNIIDRKYEYILAKESFYRCIKKENDFIDAVYDNFLYAAETKKESERYDTFFGQMKSNSQQWNRHRLMIKEAILLLLAFHDQDEFSHRHTESEVLSETNILSRIAQTHVEINIDGHQVLDQDFEAWFKNRVNWVTQSQRTSPIGSASMGRARI